nr:Protein PAF1-like protein [Ipomoea batatas]
MERVRGWIADCAGILMLSGFRRIPEDKTRRSELPAAISGYELLPTEPYLGLASSHDIRVLGKLFDISSCVIASQKSKAGIIRIHPTDQTSIAAVYSEQLRSSSGARYQRVTTYSVMKSVSDVVLAKPKSPIFRSQFELRSKLLGFRSRCNTFAECTYFSPLKSWYIKYCKVHQILSVSGTNLSQRIKPHAKMIYIEETGV